MPPEIITLVDKRLPFILGVAAGVLLSTVVEWSASRRRRRGQRETSRSQPKPQEHSRSVVAGPWQRSFSPNDSKYRDAADQLRIVMGAYFSVRPLLNRHEARVFRELDQIVTDRNPGWQVMAQVSLGEILYSEDARAYSCINSKRVDLLLVDAACRPMHAIEYQGVAHHQGSAAARDAIKKEALRRAGIGYHEVVAGLTTPSDLRRLVLKLVDSPVAVQRRMAVDSATAADSTIIPGSHPGDRRGR